MLTVSPVARLHSAIATCIVGVFAAASTPLLAQTAAPVLIGTCLVPNTGDTSKWTTASSPIERAAGVHDLYFVFTGGETTKFDYWKFQ